MILNKVSMHIIRTLKQRVNGHRSSQSSIVRFGVTILDDSWNTFINAKRFFLDPEFRSILLLKLLNSKNVHQTTPYTYFDRYPTIFSACSKYFEGKQYLKILSYGCSTGEEVMTLKRYFPSAQIIGADINKRSLAKCRKLPVDDNISFIYSSPGNIEKHGHFDAIFCMAVFQRKPHFIAAKGISSLKEIYPFEKFESQIIELDKLINSGGLLVVHFSQYSLVDTIVSPNYEPLGNYNQSDYLSPVFDKNSKLIKKTTLQYSVFRKK